MSQIAIQIWISPLTVDCSYVTIVTSRELAFFVSILTIFNGETGDFCIDFTKFSP